MSGTVDNRSQRLADLRQLMAKTGFDGWIIGRKDMYQGEEVPASEERLAYLSGFTGSAGFAIVLREIAGLFSDGRYSLQMESQTNKSNWQCNTTPDVNFESWLKAAQLPDGFKIGIDEWLVTVSDFERFEERIDAAGGRLVSHCENLLDMLWTDRPALPPSATWQMSQKFANKTVAQKLEDLGKHLEEKGCQAVLITRADSVNWLVNMRGADLPFTPITLCFALFHRQGNLHIFGDETGLG